MQNPVIKYNLKIDKRLYNFINLDVLPGTSIDQEKFWKGFSKLVTTFNPINKKLLKEREDIQDKLNEWHKNKSSKDFDYLSYRDFLYKIGYLVKEGPDFKINTKNVDPEISHVSGPQLVVPITNARYSLNAVNARWGSLYDALYGTDVIQNISQSKSYDPKRGIKVIQYAKSHLDILAPLLNAKWQNVIKIKIEEDKILKFILKDKTHSFLKNPNQIVGYQLNKKNSLSELVLVKNELNCRIIFDSNDKIGKSDPVNISDIVLESAISTILDCEDSVSTVDTEDKILAYKNWLGLMQGNLISEFIKNNQKIKRSLNNNIELKTLNGNKMILKGRSLMLIRNVGHLMTTSSILDENGEQIGEGLMDCIITSLIALHDINKDDGIRNSYSKSIYIVKPKMHGPKEVKFTNDIFEYVERILGLPINTIKVGIMDEERRTSVNLKECIRAAKSRVAFINTGFLDRTGDEIHTSMYAGPFIQKNAMKSCKWIKAYEERNVKIGLECGLQNRAQIGKGMWAMPDLMSKMVEQKINHLRAGANCAWVPSPTAATLHSMHYHKIDVKEIQNSILKNNEKINLINLLDIPLINRKNLSDEEINSEIENNSQSILGYVVRWVDQGVGCSKVPDINNIGLMEDRATCRISSQSLTNWLLHNIITKEQVENSLRKMAKIVDIQNQHDPNYIKMSDNFDTLAFKAVHDLIFKGLEQPSGYTEPILHKRRIQIKKLNNS